jgi:hypothetical protein
MYMPLPNYKDLEHEFLDSYWSQGKDILGVTHFGELVPEVLCLGPYYESILFDLIALRIDYKHFKYKGAKPPEALKAKILDNKRILKTRMEEELISRLEALRRYLRSPSSDPHLSLEEIFRKKRSRRLEGFKPLLDYLKKHGERLLRADDGRVI